jgi:predicted short-subunit dehydrogenase-like oxidoreductase (DUF2520 family)
MTTKMGDPLGQAIMRCSEALVALDQAEARVRQAEENLAEARAAVGPHRAAVAERLSNVRIIVSPPPWVPMPVAPRS